MTPDKSNSRIIIYFSFGILLTIGMILGHLSGLTDWRGSVQLHTLMEAIATLLALTVGVMAVVRFYSKKDNTFLFIGTGFIGTAFLDGYHTIVTSTFFAQYLPSELPSLIPWSWIASRLFLSVFIYLSFLAWKREDRLGNAGKISENWAFWGSGLLTLASFLFFAFVPLPRAYFQGTVFHRPEEFLPALFFLLALIGYLRQGKWRREIFEHWLILTLIVSFMGQAVFMSHSGMLFDFEFDIAHLLKKVSYIFVLTGLMINMYTIFRQADDGAERIRAVVDNIADAIITIDEQGIIQSANPGTERIFGFSNDELIGKNVSSLAAEPFRSEHDGYLSNYLHSGIPKVIGKPREVEGKRKNGLSFPMDLTVTELRIGNERLFLGIVRDITARKQAEEKLRDSQRLLQTVFDTIPHWVMVKNRQSDYLIVNEAFAKSYGKTPADFENLSPYDLGLSKEEVEIFLKADREVIETGKRVEQPEQEITYPNGQKSIQRAIRLPLLDNSGNVVGIVVDIEDITDRKKVERVKSEFLSTVSHELRTPLTSIRGSLGMISSGRLGEIPEKAAKMVTMARRNSERLINLVNDLLDVEKLQSGNLDFRFERLDLTRLVEKSLESMRPFADEHGVTLELTHTIQDAYITGDSDRLVQVVTNLLSNAAKFSSAGDKIELSVARIGKMIRVSVSDRGPGIPEDFRDRIFDRFTQADSSDTRKKGGTGLGLNISKAIIESHRGAIDFETTLGEGSTFYFELPDGAEPEQELGSGQPVVPDIPLSKIEQEVRVLVVEDDPDVAHLISMMLEQNGFNTDIAQSADQAKEILAVKKFHAITVDVVLPDQDGIAFIRELRIQEEHKDLAIIVVSAKAKQTRREVVTSAMGVLDWLEKPIDQNRLLNAIKKAPQRAAAKIPSVLYVEDDGDLTEVIASLVEGIVELTIAPTLQEATAILENRRFDLVILDVTLPDGSGLDLLPLLKNGGRATTPVIVFSAKGVDSEISKIVDIALEKSKISNEELLATIKSLLPSGPELRNVEENRKDR